MTRLPALNDYLRHRHLSDFGHIARLVIDVPANGVLMVNVANSVATTSRSGYLPVHEDSAVTLSVLWLNVVRNGHGEAQQFSRTAVMVAMVRTC